MEEAESESLQGMRAVLDVVRNRSKVLGKTSCEVVSQKGQFSFYHKKFKWKLTQRALQNWRIVSTMEPVVESAWYFNSGKRIRKYKFIRRIGLHNFYLREQHDKSNL